MAECLGGRWDVKDYKDGDSDDDDDAEKDDHDENNHDAGHIDDDNDTLTCLVIYVAYNFLFTSHVFSQCCEVHFN